MIIRNQSIDLAIRQARKLESPDGPTVVEAHTRKARGSVSGTTIATYLGVFLFVVSVIALAYHPPAENQARADASSPVASAQKKSDIAPVSSVDQLVAMKFASSLASSTDLPVSADVANLSQSLSIESALAQTDSNVISKPQIIQLNSGSRSIQSYTAVTGDTVASVAAKYGISGDTVKWANNLTSDVLSPGKELTILPITGVLYTVKAGDTFDSIATRYGSSSGAVISYNDLELSTSPATGTRLILPGGVLPAEERPGYVARTAPLINIRYGGGETWKPSHAWLGPKPSNGYPFGQCTWYAAVRRAELGMPVGNQWGNGGSWAASGRAAGRSVNGVPAAGAIMVNGGGYGHVAIVEAVADGKVYISEMNGYRGGGGWGRVGYIVIPWGEATSGMYQYVH